MLSQQGILTSFYLGIYNKLEHGV